MNRRWHQQWCHPSCHVTPLPSLVASHQVPQSVPSWMHVPLVAQICFLLGILLLQDLAPPFVASASFCGQQCMMWCIGLIPHCAKSLVHKHPKSKCTLPSKTVLHVCIIQIYTYQLPGPMTSPLLITPEHSLSRLYQMSHAIPICWIHSVSQCGLSHHISACCMSNMYT